MVPLESTYFLPITHDPRSLPEGHLLYSLASCHSVTLLNGHPIGDLMDLKMLESTGWVSAGALCGSMRVPLYYCHVELWDLQPNEQSRWRPLSP